MFANRNGFYYTLDRTDGKRDRRQAVRRDHVGQGDRRRTDARAAAGPHAGREGSTDLPRRHGRHQLLAAVVRSAQRLFFVNAREVVRDVLRVASRSTCRASASRAVPAARAGPDAAPTARSARSIRPPASGAGSSSPSPRRRRGLLTTASGLVFSGDAEGNFLALDSRSGKLLWRFQMGSALHGTSAITYMLDGRQHVLVPAGTTLTAWALPDVPRAPAR